MKRESGILMPMSALPGPWGIGTMGREAYKFIDFLKAAGQKYWQLLPLGPTSFGDSPYSSFSTFAGNPYFIDLQELCRQGLADEELLSSVFWGEDEERVDYAAIYKGRDRVLRAAFKKGREKYKKECGLFLEENRSWLSNYALFMALKKHFGNKCWTQWPEEDIRLRRPEAVKKYTELLSEEISYQIFVQYLFYSQWQRLRAYAIKAGIKFIGDIPIYVALDSADVWSEPRFFQLDGENIPREVSGVPPDPFTEDGQLWGNPLYDWEEMKRDGYGWWIRRIDGAKKLYDVIRIDHFRGFESYWAVPYGEKTAKNGRWRKGPGMALVGVLSSWFSSLRFIAEDLGFVTPEVQKLLSDSGLPGMKVLEFAFDPETDSDYLPHNCENNSVCYVGTHDNNTVLGWLEECDEETLSFAADYAGINPAEGWCWGLIRIGMASPSGLFIAQMQDVLELPGSCRMNTPGTDSGNWQWRMKAGADSEEIAARLLRYTKTFRRC